MTQNERELCLDVFRTGELDTDKFPTISKILADFHKRGRVLTTEEAWLLLQYMDNEY